MTTENTENYFEININIRIFNQNNSGTINFETLESSGLESGLDRFATSCSKAEIVLLHCQIGKQQILSLNRMTDWQIGRLAD